MISFYPGPSKVWEQMSVFLQNAYNSGILQVNHRSVFFEKMYAETVSLIKQKLNLPTDYEVFFTSSATECWQILVQSVFEPNGVHLHNGAFGEKWFQIAKQQLGNDIDEIKFDLSTPEYSIFESCKNKKYIAITDCETSNTTLFPRDILQKIRTQNTDSLIAIDATSSMGGENIDWQLADIWFASVQKCFGLPAGLAVMIVNKKAIELAQNNSSTLYNSLKNIIINGQKNQTTHTPNVLGIYLMNQLMHQWVSPFERIKATAKLYWDIPNVNNKLQLLVEDENMRSHTVIAFKTENDSIKKIIESALAQNMIIGKGYGKWKNSTFRIANFPAHTMAEHLKMIEFLKSI